MAKKMKENGLTQYKTQHGQLVTVEAGASKIKIKSAVDTSAQ